MKLYSEKSDVVYMTQNKDPFFAYLTKKVFEDIDWGKKNGRLLDLGCGSGRLSLEAAKRGFRVTGVDYIPKAIELAKTLAKTTDIDNRAKFIQGDLAKAKPHQYGFYDYVVLMEVIEHIDDYQKIIDFAYGSLKKGGKILLTTPYDPSSWTILDDYARHIRRFTVQQIRDALKKFTHAKVGTVGFPLHKFFISLYNMVMNVKDLKHRPKIFRRNHFVSALYYIVGTIVLSFDNLFAYGDGGTTIIAIAEK